MNQKQIKAAVEAMLFAAGDPVSADKLAAAVQLPQTAVETALEELRVRYAREDSGLCLLHLDTRWQLATRTEWADCIRRLLDARRSVPLGPAAMETLTVIAYNQPVSRAFIEQVRGVDSSSSVSGLLQKGLIEEAGRLDLPGHPVSFRTTDVFLRCFGLSSLADLPPVRGDQEGEHGDMMGVLMALGWLLLTLLKIAGVLLLILLVLLALVLLCPLCADVCWEGSVLTVRAGALGLTLPVFQWPAPEKPAGAEEPKGFWGKLKAKLRARREERKRKKAAAKEAKRPKKETAPREGEADAEHPRDHPAGCRAADESRLRLAARHQDPGLPRRPGRRPRRSCLRLRQAERMALPVPRRHRPLRLPRFRRAAHPAGLRQCRADGGRPGVVPPQRKAAFHRCSRSARFV